ncbi:unnamed protein product [Closterium sp. NIES-65]|nr:unnamed protein product [Closterium sp. NIES-65]
MSHPADVPVLPKGQRSRPALDPPPSTEALDPLTDPPTESAAGSTKTSVPAVNDNDSVSASAASGSGLSASDKATIPSFGVADDDGFMDDDSDDEMLIDLVKEAGSQLSADVVKTTKFQELQTAYIAKMRYCRLQVSFTLESDAARVRQKEVIYQSLKGQLVTLHWQHTDDPVFTREKAMNPHAIEFMIKGVSAAVDLILIHDRLASYPMKSTQRSAFQRCSCLHRVLHSVTGADTDVVKGLVYAHPESPAWLKASSLFLPILRDSAIALVSTGSIIEDWICTQAGCGKAKGKSLMAAAAHIKAATHLLELEKAGSATESLDKLNLAVVRTQYGL